MIDILLVLLVIFMVITPLSSHGISANLPQPATGTRSLPEPEIVLEITRDHQFIVNGQAVPRENLARELGKLFKNRVDHKLFMRADRDVDYREVALAMDDARGVDTSLQFGLLSHQ